MCFQSVDWDAAVANYLVTPEKDVFWYFGPPSLFQGQVGTTCWLLDIL